MDLLGGALLPNGGWQTCTYCPQWPRPTAGKRTSSTRRPCRSWPIWAWRSTNGGEDHGRWAIVIKMYGWKGTRSNYGKGMEIKICGMGLVKRYYLWGGPCQNLLLDKTYRKAIEIKTYGPGGALLPWQLKPRPMAWRWTCYSDTSKQAPTCWSGKLRPIDSGPSRCRGSSGWWDSQCGSPRRLRTEEAMGEEWVAGSRDVARGSVSSSKLFPGWRRKSIKDQDTVKMSRAWPTSPTRSWTTRSPTWCATGDDAQCLLDRFHNRQGQGWQDGEQGHYASRAQVSGTWRGDGSLEDVFQRSQTDGHHRHRSRWVWTSGYHQDCSLSFMAFTYSSCSCLKEKKIYGPCMCLEMMYTVYPCAPPNIHFNVANGDYCNQWVQDPSISLLPMVGWKAKTARWRWKWDVL